MSPSRPTIGVETEAASRKAVRTHATAVAGVQLPLDLRKRRGDERLQERERRAAQGENPKVRP